MKRLTILGIIIVMLAGCGGQTATQQIMQQTSDPLTLAKAAYIDASQLYIDAATAYAPYKPILEKSNPAMAADVIAKLRDANRTLDQWRGYLSLGIPGGTDTTTFKELRLLIIMAIAEAEGK